MDSNGDNGDGSDGNGGSGEGGVDSEGGSDDLECQCGVDEAVFGGV